MAEDKYTVKLYDYDYDTHERTYTDEISVSQLAKCMTPDNFVYFLDNYLNYGGKQYEEGHRVGQDMRFTHRTLQRSVVAMALGIIVGISEQEYTDARNADAIAMAKKIAEMYKNGELSVGCYI